jgi:hypothetical protein
MRTRIPFTILSCLAAAGCDLGTEGELGRGDFVYTCDVGANDPECTQYDDEQSIPWAIAEDGEFSLRYESDSGRTLTIRPASHRHAVSGPTGFAVSPAGPAGFLAVDTGARVYDLVHVMVYPTASLELRCEDWLGSSGACGAAISIELGETATIEALPLSARGDLLAGGLDYAWALDDESIASLGVNGNRFIEITPTAPGTALLGVLAGGATAQLQITVEGEIDTESETETTGQPDAGADAGGE